MNWRTTIALQKIISTKNISAKRLPRKKRTTVLLRQAHAFGNRIEIRCLLTLLTRLAWWSNTNVLAPWVNGTSVGRAVGETRPMNSADGARKIFAHSLKTFSRNW
jgi:hypothetical protein